MSSPTAPSRPPRPRRSRWLKRLALVAVSLLLALAATEIYLRTVYADMFGLAASMHRLYELDDTGWTRPAANHTFELYLAGGRSTVHLDELGLRGAPIGPRAPGEKRVLVLGDSMVFGVGVEDDQTFTALLAAPLTERCGFPVVTRSGGAPGFNTFDQVEVLRRVRDAYRPDLVVATVFLGNDYSDNFDTKTVVDGYMLNGAIAAAAKRSVRMRLALRFRVCWFVEHFLRTHVPALALDLPNPDAAAFADFPPLDQRFMNLFMNAKLETPAMARILDHLMQGLHDVQKLAGEVPVVVVLLPDPWRSKPAKFRQALREKGLDPAAHDPLAAQHRLASRCGELGLSCLDLTPAFQEQPDSDRLFLAGKGALDFHYNPAGHRLVAAELVAPLARALGH